MTFPEKSAVRTQVEGEVMAALRKSVRWTTHMTVNDLYAACDSAPDKATVARVVSALASKGRIVKDRDVAPGEPGGMPRGAKGARSVSSYRLLTAAELDAVAPARAESGLRDEGMHQGKSADAVAPVIVSAAEIAPPPPPPRPLAAREETPAPYLDAAASSANGDECAAHWDPAWAMEMPLDPPAVDEGQWASDLLQACDTSREALLTIADQLLEGDPIWAAAREVDRALMRMAVAYV